MNRLFRRLPLLSKLLIIGLVPTLFLIYVSIQLYHEKTEKVKLVDRYMGRIQQAADINALIDNLQEERKYSFDYTMTGSMRNALVIQRPRTNRYIKRLKSSKDENLYGFTTYTKLDELDKIRGQVDSGKANPNIVMHYYSNMIFRLNTLNVVPTVNQPYLEPVYKDLVTQKLLSEMITYLGIIRSNIYNVLHTRQYMVETLIGTTGTHDVLTSYEQEFSMKASPEVIKAYDSIKTTGSLQPTMDYIDTLFKRFTFDSSYDARSWWELSEAGTNELRAFQNKIWDDVNTEMNIVKAKEQHSIRVNVFFLILAILVVVGIVVYTVHIISTMLKELEVAAEKISIGDAKVAVHADSKDVVGSLADSIVKIDVNNQQLADAAIAIGKGDYAVHIEPRSEQDVLGNAIIEMKDELQKYRDKMELLVEERTEQLNRSNEDLQQFAHVASHDLKEPLRKIRAFSERLNEEIQGGLSEKGKTFFDKIQNASERMSTMIEGILSYSIVDDSNERFVPIDLAEMVEGIKNDLELAIQQKKASIKYDVLPVVAGIPLLIHQLFYNLIYNSLKFSREGVLPVITISYKKPAKMTLKKIRNVDQVPDFVEVIIEDNGIGFDQQFAESMFNPFTRLNSREKFEGTGLGLALCKKIVQRHHGFISAEGRAGEGARFHVVLPAATV